MSDQADRSLFAFASVSCDGSVTESGSTQCVPWWSFSKTVLAIATLRLAEQGMLELDGPVADQPYTARQLLRHEAGLPDYGAMTAYHRDVAAGERPWSLDRLLAAADVHRLRFLAGTDWAYSNIGYLKVAQLIEQRTGLTLRDALASLVFGPAGLRTARLASEPADLIDVQMGDITDYHPGWVYHGLVVGTAADAARVLWTLLSGRLLKRDSVSEMLKPRALPTYRSDLHPDPGYGLGLMLSATAPEMHPMGHTGEGPGSRISVHWADGIAAAVWAAGSSGVDPERLTLEYLQSRR